MTWVGLSSLVYYCYAPCWASLNNVLNEYTEMQWNEKKRTEMNKHCNVWKIKSAAVDGAFRSSVVMPVISDQDTGKSHTFEKPLNKVSNIEMK